jgi:hypothetical protein
MGGGAGGVFIFSLSCCSRGLFYFFSAAWSKSDAADGQEQGQGQGQEQGQEQEQLEREVDAVLDKFNIK